MQRTLFAAAAMLTAFAAATPASAAIVIGVGFNGGAVTQVATDAGTPGTVNYNVLSGNYFYNSGGTGAPLLLTPSMLTQSINLQQASTTGGTLNLYITQTDLAAFTGLLTSAFTSNTIGNATAVISSYYSTANELFGGALLRSTAFNGTGTFAAGNLLAVTGPFSTTVRYDITFGPGLGNFNGTANLLATAVPEPLTWAMMVIGFAGLGFAIRRSPAVKARIRFAA